MGGLRRPKTQTDWNHPSWEANNTSPSETNGRPIGTLFHVLRISTTVAANQRAYLLCPPLHSFGIEILLNFLNVNAAPRGQPRVIQTNVAYRSESL